MMTKSERSSYTTLDFIQWKEGGTLVISPKFQRRGVWNRAARSYLIDTLLLGLPVPPIYLRVTQDTEKKKMIREIVDGQQRISAILDFVEGGYSLAKNIESPVVGKRFDALSPAQQNAITQYSFVCEVFYGIEDQEILKIFSRLNTNSVPLNAQELRNGKYFGEFKKASYSLALEHLEFWRGKRIFTEQAIARMNEAELTSELLIVAIDGLQDKKKSIERYYQNLDETFAERRKLESRFRETIDLINESVGDVLRETEFRRGPLFYSLYAATYHRAFGVPGLTIKGVTPGKFNKSDYEGLSETVVDLSEVISAAKREEEYPEAYDSFVTACLRQTDNIKPRRTRTEVIAKKAFS